MEYGLFMMEITDPHFGLRKSVDKRLRKGMAGLKRRLGWNPTTSDKKAAQAGIPASAELYRVAKASEMGHKRIEYLKTLGIIRRNIGVDEIDDLAFGRLFTLSQLLQWLKLG